MGLLILGPAIVALLVSSTIAILSIVAYSGLHSWLKRGPILLFVLLSVSGAFLIISLPEIFGWDSSVMFIIFGLAPCGVILGFLSLFFRAK